jgi:hypothetical protein
MKKLSTMKFGKVMLISNVWSVETPRYPSIAARSPAEPPKACRPQEGLKSIAPKHPEVLGRAIRHAPPGRPSFPT